MNADLMIITSGLQRGGAEGALYRLLSHQRMRSLKVVVVSLTGNGVWGEPIAALGIPVFQLGLASGDWVKLTSAALELRRLVRTWNPRIVQGWMYHGNVAASFTRLLDPFAKRKITWGIRHALHDPAGEKVFTRLLIKAGFLLAPAVEAIVYNSATAAEQHQRLGYPGHRSVVIPNGVDLTEFRPDESRRLQARIRLGVSADTLVVGTLARYHPTKDFPSLVAAAGQVVRELAGKQAVRFIFAGDGVDASNAPLTSDIRAAGLSDQVLFAAVTDSPAELIPAFDLALMTSRSEAFPNFAVEALACGVPLVATAVGDCPAIAAGAGEVAAPGDPAAIANLLIKILLNAELRKAYAREGLRKVSAQFSLDTMAQRYRELYDRLLVQ